MPVIVKLSLSLWFNRYYLSSTPTVVFSVPKCMNNISGHSVLSGLHYSHVVLFGAASRSSGDLRHYSRQCIIKSPSFVTKWVPEPTYFCPLILFRYVRFLACLRSTSSCGNHPLEWKPVENIDYANQTIGRASFRGCQIALIYVRQSIPSMIAFAGL